MKLYKFRDETQMQFGFDVIFERRFFCADWRFLNDPTEGLFTHSHYTDDDLYKLHGDRLGIRGDIASMCKHGARHTRCEALRCPIFSPLGSYNASTSLDDWGQSSLPREHGGAVCRDDEIRQTLCGVTHE